jgi:hypothetical protein
MIDLSSKEGPWSFDAARTAIAVALRATATARARRNAAEGQASCLPSACSVYAASGTARARASLRQPSEHHEIGVKGHALQAASPERGEPHCSAE